jgi:polysaccharide transporter, PST family
MTGAEKKTGVVLRNTLFLVGSQALGVPLSVALNAVMGRYLGAGDFGYFYLASTLIGFGFLFVEWGHGGVMAAAIARDRGQAGVMLGSTLLWRSLASVAVGIVLMLVAEILRYPPAFRSVLFLAIVAAIIGSFRSAYQDAARGFERLDVGAYAQLGGQLLNVFILVPVMMLGGRIRAVQIAAIVIAAFIALGVYRAWRSIASVPVRNDRATHRVLFSQGSSFLLFGFVMALQPNVDAIFLSKLSSAEVLGWQAAAQRLQGIVIMPAAALGSALYPTLSRLYAENRAEYQQTATQSLQGTALLAIPAALCCALYRGAGVRLFGRDSFQQVEQNLLVLSSVVFLLYFSMPIGTAILAAGRHRAFAIVQSLCIVSSVALDPLLIPWFQQRFNNGGLGVCVANVVSECAVILVSLKLLPSGILSFSLLKSLGKGLLSGAVMAGVAFALGSFNPYLAAPISLVAYFGCLWLIGGIEPSHMEAIKGVVLRKIARRSQP